MPALFNLARRVNLTAALARALCLVAATAASIDAQAARARSDSAPAGAQSTSQRAAPQTFAIRNATVVPVVGSRIANGTVLVRAGKIEAVGANVTVPADATVIDATGLFVYPGMIDSGTGLGLTEIGSVEGSDDTGELGDFNPQNVALTAVNAHSELIPVTRVNGVTTVITAASGGLVSGQASLIDLAGWTPNEMAVRRQAAMVMTYPQLGGGFGGFGGFGPQRSEAERREEFDRRVRMLRAYFADARAYADVKSRTPTGRRVNAAMEAMVPVVRGELPILFDVSSADQIRSVLALVDSFQIKVILRGASGAWRLADTLAARQIPVIVGPTTSMPSADDPYDMIFANPGVLARAGVKIAFQTASSANSRNLPYNAALATAYGLDADEALRALTINPAQIWGVSDRYGSIEAGKVANLMVTTGDPLDVRSVVRHLFIRGQNVTMNDRHTRLYEQFRARPRP